jgi:hypothetical protein
MAMTWNPKFGPVCNAIGASWHPESPVEAARQATGPQSLKMEPDFFEFFAPCYWRAVYCESQLAPLLTAI